MRRFPALMLLCATLSACQSTPPEGSSSNPLILNWSVPERSFGSAFLSGDLLFSGDNIRAINLNTKNLAFNLPIPVDSYIDNYTVFDGNILVKTYDKNKNEYLTIINPKGEVLNSILIPGEPRSSTGEHAPTLTETALYLSSGPGLYKYNRADLMKPDARPVWVKNYDGFTLASFYAKDDDHVYVMPNDLQHTVIAYDGNGKERWRKQVNTPDLPGGQSFVMQAYKGNLILEIGVQGLLALNMETGEKVWGPNTLDLCPIQGTISTNLTIADDKLFLAPNVGVCVLAFDANTGKNLWVFKSPNEVTFGTYPLYLNGVIYANNSTLYALDANTGKLLAQGRENLGENGYRAVVYDSKRGQILSWGNTGLFSYKPIR